MPAAPYLVAMCDVLGFTNLIAEVSLEEIHRRYLDLVARLEPHPVFRIRPGTHEREIVLNRVVFSDTILFWAPAGETMELLPYVVAQVMSRAMGSMPLRAGFALGDCVIDPANELYIGQPIVDAYRTEQAQDWIGGAFHPSCWRWPGLRETLGRASAVRYAVPVKAGSAAGAAPLEYALNWPALAGPDFSGSTLAAQEHRAPAAARGKWRNARIFYEAIRSGPSGGEPVAPDRSQ
jgi:hypothetical protein